MGGLPHGDGTLEKGRWLHIPLIAAAALAAASLPVYALANGRIAIYERKAAGPYEIGLGTIPPSPSVGNLHLSITVTETATEAPVANAAVVVEGTGPDSAEVEIGPTPAAGSVQDPSYYEVNTAVDREGWWSFTTTVADDAGEHSAEFRVEVRNASPLPGILTLSVLVAFLVVFGLAIRASLGGRKGKRRRSGGRKHKSEYT